ncbi:hypothetical protein [uncultured Brachyspira sp.]|uniref:hypothetical protein n=1 Tax=uncultured Brachyspira sp. TaxID=221953 RepID=UPI0025FC9821|nr:hypothetical protein [uncultured Brachyspira sp.]
MSIAITFILNLIKNKLFEFVKSKYFLVFILLSVIAIIIISISLQLKSKYKKIKELKYEIKTLKETNALLIKDNIFKQRQLYILEVFTNSDNYIKKIDDRKLDKSSIDAVNAVINDYYKTLQLK